MVRAPIGNPTPIAVPIKWRTGSTLPGGPNIRLASGAVAPSASSASDLLLADDRSCAPRTNWLPAAQPLSALQLVDLPHIVRVRGIDEDANASMNVAGADQVLVKVWQRRDRRCQW